MPTPQAPVPTQMPPEDSGPNSPVSAQPGEVLYWPNQFDPLPGGLLTTASIIGWMLGVALSAVPIWYAFFGLLARLLSYIEPDGGGKSGLIGFFFVVPPGAAVGGLLGIVGGRLVIQWYWALTRVPWVYNREWIPGSERSIAKLLGLVLLVCGGFYAACHLLGWLLALAYFATHRPSA